MDATGCTQGSACASDTATVPAGGGAQTIYALLLGKRVRMIDPFHIKRLSKLDPRRLGFTAYARLSEHYARARFSRFEIPYSGGNGDGRRLTPDIPDTDVNSEQMETLLRHFSEVQETLGGETVEVGAFRGVTTQKLAERAKGTVYAVDPYTGYGGSEQDLAIFQRRTGQLANVRHVRKPSGLAARELQSKKIGFVFIDAVHDFVNVAFDRDTWFALLQPGGLIAFHDVDEIHFAGSRRAAYQLGKRAELVAHVNGLAIFRKAALAR
jgi:predicted O-methyltransferase YrrM